MKNKEKKIKKKHPRIQGAAWRRLDNTAKLFAAVSGEDPDLGESEGGGGSGTSPQSLAPDTPGI